MRANEWITVVSERLHRRWPSVDPARLDDVASDLWADAALRAMEPAAAADEWLRPVTVPGTNDPVADTPVYPQTLTAMTVHAPAPLPVTLPVRLPVPVPYTAPAPDLTGDGRLLL